MSHWTTIQTQLRDRACIAAAVAELGCTLITPDNVRQAIADEADRNSATGECFGHPGKIMARGWGGRTVPADAMIRVPGCRYDVALHRQSDGSYAVAADLWSGEIGAKLGEEFGKLKQLYGVHVATAQARKMGCAATRVLGAKGSINVVITGRL